MCWSSSVAARAAVERASAIIASATAATSPVTKALAPSSKKSMIPGLRLSMSAFPLCRPRSGSLISRARAGAARVGKRRDGEEMWRKNA